MSRSSLSLPFLLAGIAACEEREPYVDKCENIAAAVESDGLAVAKDTRNKCDGEIENCAEVLGAQVYSVYAASDAAFTHCDSSWGKNVDGTQVDPELGSYDPEENADWTRAACDAVAQSAMQAAAVCHETASDEDCNPVVGGAYGSAQQACLDYYNLDSL